MVLHCDDALNYWQQPSMLWAWYPWVRHLCQQRLEHSWSFHRVLSFLLCCQWSTWHALQQSKCKSTCKNTLCIIRDPSFKQQACVMAHGIIVCCFPAGVQTTAWLYGLYGMGRHSRERSWSSYLQKTIGGISPYDTVLTLHANCGLIAAAWRLACEGIVCPSCSLLPPMPKLGLDTATITALCRQTDTQSVTGSTCKTNQHSLKPKPQHNDEGKQLRHKEKGLGDVSWHSTVSCEGVAVCYEYWWGIASKTNLHKPQRKCKRVLEWLSEGLQHWPSDRSVPTTISPLHIPCFASCMSAAQEAYAAWRKVHNKISCACISVLNCIRLTLVRVMPWLQRTCRQHDSHLLRMHLRFVNPFWAPVIL